MCPIELGDVERFPPLTEPIVLPNAMTAVQALVAIRDIRNQLFHTYSNAHLETDLFREYVKRLEQACFTLFGVSGLRMVQAYLLEGTHKVFVVLL